MANLLKVVLVPEGTNLPSERSDVTILSTKDIINTNGGGGLCYKLYFNPTHAHVKIAWLL